MIRSLLLLLFVLAGGLSAQNVDFRATTRSGAAPLDVQFQLRYTGTLTPSWDFGDGGTAAQRTPLHTYTTAGTYTVTLTIPEPAGNIVVTKANYITVAAGGGGGGGGGATEITALPQSGVAPLSVDFSAVLPDNVSVRQWQFGDGATSNAVAPTHVYTAEGSYTVTLRYRTGAGTPIESVTLADPIVVTPEPVAFTVEHPKLLPASMTAR